MALSAGARLGPYEIVSLIGAGGMGEVYRARDPRLGREVAVKVLPAALSRDSDRQRRLEREARAAAALNHPNILAVYDIGTDGDKTYVVSELLRGEALRSRLSLGALSPRKTVEYAIQIAHGLAAAHETGIVHRDLKPENLFVTTDGRVKILDFGLAKTSATGLASGPRSDVPTATFETHTGAVLGTIGYMAPEQLLEQPTDHRTDIFALGAICHEMLTGARAFGRPSAAETMTAILREDPPDLSVVRSDVPPVLGHIVRHCLEKRPAERFQSTRDLAFALEAVARASEAQALLFEPATADARQQPVEQPQFQSANGSAFALAATEPAAGRVVERSPALARERRLWAVAVSVLALAVAWLAYALYQAHQDAAVRAHLVFAVPQKGSVGFEIGNGIAEVLREASGDLDVTTQALEGSIGAARLLDTGQAQLGLVNNLVAFHAVKTERVLGHRAKFAGVAVLHANPAQILIPQDASIASLQDLRGKRVSVGPPGWGEGLNSEILLSHFGLGPGNVTIIHKDVEPSLSGVLDGSLDAFITWRGVPLSEISKTMTSGRLRLLAVDRELVEGLRLNHPFLIPVTIPKGTYVHQDASVSTVSSKVLLVASTSLPPRVVDQILNTIATKIPDLIARHPTASEIDLRKRPTVADGMSIELHPGAEMFYQRASRP